MLSRELAPRDGAVVELVGRLNQVSSGHIQTLLFNDVTRIPKDRALNRLVAQDYLMRIGRRAPGAKGGNAPVVYQLGRRGWWYVGKAGKYWGRRAVSEHSLIVADLFTRLVVMDRAGEIKLLEMEPEYSAGHSRADLYVDAGIPSIGKRRKYCIEVQRSARPDVITRKLRAYAQTFSTSQLDVWPYLVFLVNDRYHQSGIARQVPAEVSEWVRVWRVDSFFSALVSL